MGGAGTEIGEPLKLPAMWLSEDEDKRCPGILRAEPLLDDAPFFENVVESTSIL